MKARKVIASEIPLADVAMQLAGLGDGNTLVALLDEVASVVQHHYVQQHKDYKKRIATFVERTDDVLDGNAVALLRAMIERAERDD